MEVIVQHVVKFRLRRDGEDSIYAQVFFGPDKDHLQNAGHLVFRVGEWQSFGCALGLGLNRMIQATPDATFVTMQMIVEGEMAALGREMELKDGNEDVRVTPLVDHLR